MKNLFETITEINEQKQYRIGTLESDNKIVFTIKNLATGKHFYIKMTAENVSESMEQLNKLL